ncbi:MAG: hypothetical protein WBP79_05845 [Candidatus Acidiferrales bacterium]
MPRTKRTTKKLAQRIDLNYFKRPYPFRTWRFALSVVLPVLAVIWLAGFGLARNHGVYSAGKMSPAHAVMTERCSACHVSKAGMFSAKSSDQACLLCHDGPIHHSNQAFTPNCSSCHVEHRGHFRLAATADMNCSECHTNLRTTGAATTFARSISGFNDDHPEFAALRPGFADPGTIKLNHAIHMKANLKGPSGSVQLDCDDCHRSNRSDQKWRFSLVGATDATSTAQVMPVAPAQKPGPPSRAGGRAYMGPITYAKQCAGCHPLPFDKRFVESVPHDTPDVIHAFLVKKFQEYIAAHPAELREPISTIALPAKPVPVSPRVYSPPAQWVEAKVAEAELLLWKKACKECHTLNPSATSPLPAVAKSNITVRWFQHAVFDHDQHRLVNCTSCHSNTPTSKETADVLLPGIRTCRQCHNSRAEGAESRCFECHTYHDWKNEKEVKSKFTLSELIHGKPAGSAAQALLRDEKK